MLADSETMTLERALAPLMTTGAFCNLVMLEYPLGQSRTYITCLYGLAKWSLLIYFYYYPYYINIFGINKIFIVNIITLLTIILIPINICRFKELKICLRELAIVDHTLEAFGTPKEYQKLRNWIIRIIIGWIVYVCYCVTHIAFLYSVGYDATISWGDILDIFLQYYPYNAVALSALISAAILGDCASNTSLNCTVTSFRCLDLLLKKNDVAELCSKSIKNIMSLLKSFYVHFYLKHVHLQLCLVSRKLNKVLKVQMSIEMVWYFYDALAICLKMYEMLTAYQLIWNFIFTFVHLCVCFNFVLRTILFLTLHYICQTVYNEVYINILEQK
ncbi:hypothetical protein ALC57_18776 [Trachymyrmex cornetzi]|uniref:Gustatory receptor n=1 Tax=Trachymyrmex cornetzi TaxID=471704 RepID=A0A151IRB6_9HYME|nr:hypothetical protein ALC57_18776 [Trachymyrmex cornetzi]